MHLLLLSVVETASFGYGTDGTQSTGGKKHKTSDLLVFITKRL
jgi:hypothetical protein